MSEVQIENGKELKVKYIHAQQTFKIVSVELINFLLGVEKKWNFLPK